MFQVSTLGQTAVPNGAPSFTRPANVTAYAVGDVIMPDDNSNWGWPNIVERDRPLGGYLVRATLATTQAACTARFRLWFLTNLYATLAGGTPTDNAALNLGSADFAAAQNVITTQGPNTTPPRVLGYIDFPACASVGAGAMALWTGQFQFFCCEGITGIEAPALFGLLQTRDAFTPDSEQQFSIAIGVERG